MNKSNKTTDHPKVKPARRGAGRPSNAEAASREDPRVRLEQIAVSLFAEYGYDAVSTGDVAREANLSQPMVHYHFGSKENLWKAAITRLMRDRGRRFPTNPADLKGLDPVSRLKAITRRFIMMSASDPTFSKIITQEGLTESDRLKWLVDKYIRHGFAEFDDAVQAGIDQGLIRDLPVYIISNVIITASSFVFYCDALVKVGYGIDVKDPARIEELVDGIVDILFRGLLVSDAG